MAWLSNLYSQLLFGAATVALILAIICWRQRRAPGATPLALVCLSVVVWCGGYGVFWSLTTLPARTAALNVVSLGVALTATTFFVFSLSLTGHSAWLTRNRRGALVGVCVAIATMAWVNPWQVWYTHLELHSINGLLVLETRFGPAYTLAICYTYALIIVNSVVLIYELGNTRGIYRTQYLWILGAVAVTLLSSLASDLGWTPWPYLDLGPMAFALSGPMMALAVFRYRLLDLVPIARTVLVDSMPDAMLTLDNRDRVVDVNSAALRMLNWSGPAPVGQPATQLFEAWPELVALYGNTVEAGAEIQLGPDTILNMRIRPLRTKDGNISGRLIVARDITELKHAEAELQNTNKRLQTQLDEIETLQKKLREQAIRDPLTGLLNRRYLEETLPREVAQAERSKLPISVAFIDVDHFKTVNDTYGHSTGDQVLQTLSVFLEINSRGSDMVCRYGGEEFVIVLLGATTEIAARRAEQWRSGVEQLKISIGGLVVQITISIGLATLPTHSDTIDKIFLAADKALYAAKKSGRNCVCQAHLLETRSQ